MANLRQLLLSFLSALFFWVQPVPAQNWAAQAPPYGRPDATVDLRTKEGTQLVKGDWRYSDVKIVEVDAKGPGPDLKPSGAPIKTYDYLPKAGAADFDDSQWEVLDAATLEQRRSTGKLCFNWYRINITIPERIGRFDPTGAAVALEVVID